MYGSTGGWLLRRRTPRTPYNKNNSCQQQWLTGWIETVLKITIHAMRLVIVEDEALIAGRIERLCRDILGPRLQTLSVRPTLAGARAHLREHPIDVLLLDLNLNGLDGFQLLREAVAGSFHTLVISAYAERAVEAFEYGVLDFIPKPFSRERLARALERCERTDYHTNPPLKYLATRVGSRLDLHAIEEVLYISGANHYAELHLRDGSVRLHDKPLSRLVPLLPPAFPRVHKSYIVNLTAVRSLHTQAGGKYLLELVNGEHIPVGRGQYKLLREQLL